MQDWKEETVVDGKWIRTGGTVTTFTVEVRGNAMGLTNKTVNGLDTSTFVQNFHYTADAFGEMRIHNLFPSGISDYSGMTAVYSSGKITLTQVMTGESDANVLVMLFEKV